MKSALAYREPSTPLTWLELPMGQTMLGAINQEIAPWASKFFGYHLLKIGALSGEIDCHLSPIKHQITVSGNRQNAGVIADIDDLPFVEHSVDVCVLGHALEFSVDPHHVLREANRVLIPNGYMVLTGYNPISLAGMNKLLPFRRKQSPWCEHFFTPMRVKDWLALMGFEIMDDIRVLHSTLAGKDIELAVDHNAGQQSDISSGGDELANSNGDSACLQSETFGKRGIWQKFASNYMSALGSVYIIVAKKRVHPLTPIKPKWRIRPSIQPARVPSMNSNRQQRE